MIGGPIDGPHALALGERLLDLLAEAGIDDAVTLSQGGAEVVRPRR